MMNGVAVRRPSSVVKQKIVQRCVGQHHAQHALTGRYQGGDGLWSVPAAVAFKQKHNGLLARFQQGALLGRDVAVVFNGCDVGHHQRERFVNPTFALAEFGNGFFVGGTTREVKTAQPFDGDDLALREEAFCL